MYHTSTSKEEIKIYTEKRKFGNVGEEVACRYLKSIGYEVIERNFMCRVGEIDIVAKDRDEMVFIEVKTRSNVCFGRPREAVDGYKQKHIYRSTRYYLHIHGLDNAFVRFDVVEVYLVYGKYKIKHLKQVDIKG